MPVRHLKYNYVYMNDVELSISAQFNFYFKLSFIRQVSFVLLFGLNCILLKSFVQKSQKNLTMH